MSGNADVVEFFQRDEPPRGRAIVPSRPLSAEVRREEDVQRAEEVLPGETRPLETSGEVRELVMQALDAARLTKDAAAGRMRISASLFGRQLQNLDNHHVSLQRLYRLPDAFWREFLLQIVERRLRARVRRGVTRVVFDL